MDMNMNKIEKEYKIAALLMLASILIGFITLKASVLVHFLFMAFAVQSELIVRSIQIAILIVILLCILVFFSSMPIAFFRIRKRKDNPTGVE